MRVRLDPGAELTGSYYTKPKGAEMPDWIEDLRSPKLWVAWVGPYETGGFKPLGAHPDVESARVYAEAFHPGYGQIVQVAGDES